MKSIIECYNEINESFNSNFARMIKQDIETSRYGKTQKKNFNDLQDKLNIDRIAWNKLEDSDFEKWVDVEVLLRLIRAIRAGKPDFIGANLKRVPIKDTRIVVFGYKGDMLRYVYASRYDSMTDMVNGSYINAPKSVTDSLREDCDAWYVLMIGENDMGKLISDRSMSKAHIIPTTSKEDKLRKHDLQGVLGVSAGGIDWDKIRYGETTEYEQFCRGLIKDTKERYKKIIAQNKFKRTSSTEDIDNMVKECMDIYFKILQDSTKDKDKYTYSEIGTVNKLIQGEAKGGGSGSHTYGYISGGLLKSYTDYLYAVKQLSTDTSYTDMYLKDRDNNDKYIRAVYQKLRSIVKS